MSLDSLPSIDEQQARGSIARLYADIRATLKVPAVNLVWRHLAVADGALDWAWSAVKPLYLHACLAAEGSALAERPSIPRLDNFTDQQLRAAAVATQQLIIIRRVLNNYHYSNPRNLIALLALKAAIHGGVDASPLAETAASVAGSELAALPPLLPESSMDSDTRVAARRLEVLGTGLASGPVVAGVPRHLAHWPGFLHLSVQALAAHEAAVALAIIDLQQAAGQAACRCAGLLIAPSSGPLEASVMAAVERFCAPELITNYIVKVQALRRALPP